MSDHSPQDPKRKVPERRREKKPSFFGSNAMLFLLIALVGFAVVVGLWPMSFRSEVDYSTLTTLIEAGPDGQVEVTTGQGEQRRTYRYSGLFALSGDHPLEIGPEEMTGRILRQQLSPEQGEPREVSFVVYPPWKDGPTPAFESLINSQKSEGLRYTGTRGTGNFPTIWFMFLSIIFVVMIIVLLLRRIGGAGNPMTFGRSRGKMYAQEDIGVTFDDVAGIDEAVDELREVVEFLKTPEKYQILGGRIPKGVLLVGPPGTGKTLLAKAIAGEAGVPFFSLSGSDFVEMFVGVGAARVRDMFGQAESKAPCIIFIDELDALGKTRGGSLQGSHDEREQTLNALLVEMDGFGTNAGIIIMGATNRPETLDPALLRPGRFDRHVLVDKPDVRGREQILKVHIQQIKTDDKVELKKLAAITSGFVGADLANLVNEAALLAARKGKDAVGMEEFNEGVERVTAGLEKKQRIIHEDEKQRVAYHESGHALVAYSLPNTDPVHKVSIIPRGLAALGYMMQRPEQDRYLMTQGELESRIKVLLAGTVTEELVFEEVSTGAQNDLERCSDIARRMVMEFGMSRLGRVNYRESGRSAFLAGSDGQRVREHSEQTAREIDEEVCHIIEAAQRQVREILEARRPALEALAARLIENEVIDAEELIEIVERNSPSAQLAAGTDRSSRTTTPPVVRPTPTTQEAAEEHLPPSAGET